MLNRLAKSIVGVLHGKHRNSDGLLLTSQCYLLDDQETALGQSYLGLLGLPIFLGIVFYTLVMYGEKTGGGYRTRFSSFSEMPPEVQILLPIAIAGHLIALISIFRIIFNWMVITDQRRSDIEDSTTSFD